MDIQKAREYVKNLDNKIRSMEIEKARLEENKKNTEKRIELLHREMESLNVTPDNISDIISKIEEDIKTLKGEIDSSLSGLENNDILEDSSDVW